MATGMTIVPIGTARDGTATGELYIRQGDTVSCSIAYTNTSGAVNLAGYSAKLQVRNLEQTSALLTFTTSGASPTIVLTSATGYITFKQTSTVTAALTPQKGLWDLRLVTSTGYANTIAHGEAIIVDRVTT